jgi:hypothetical protein
MRLVIAHLSDIHTKTAADPVLNRAVAIAAAIGAVDPGCTNYLFAVTGDVAFSGKTAEYDIASTFFGRLVAELKLHVADQHTSLAFVPGNHDCDFAKNSVARQLIIDGVQGDDRSAIDDSVTDVVLSPQDAYYKFAADTTGELLTGRHRLYHHSGVIFGDASVLVRCYNTAWMSTLPETANKYFPTELAQAEVSQHDLVLSLLHHPPSWFGPAHARDLRSHLESTSDVILTGHEHISTMRDTRGLDGERVTYTEGAVLQSDDPKESAFNLVVIDLGRSLQQKMRAVYSPGESAYQLKDRSDWEPFERAKHLQTIRYALSDSQVRWLSDIGTPFTHPRRDRVTLRDIFVDPELESVPSLGKPRSQPQSVSSGEMGAVLCAPGVLIVGTEQSGKSTLAKVIYERLHRDGKLPVILSGSDLGSANVDAFRNTLSRAVDEQYAATTFASYLQTPLASRVIVIDDFELCRLNRRAKCRILSVLRQYSGQVVALAHDTFMIEEIAHGKDPAEDVLADFATWRIKQFGHFLRGVLIERWCSLGLDDVADDRDLISQIADTEKLINTIRGRSMIPSYPIVLLTILQTLESNVDLNTISGSYGQRYEFLIAKRLRVTGNKILRDAVLTLVSEIAYAAFTERRRFVTETQLREATASYAATYKMDVDYNEILRTLTASLILEQHAGAFRFKYPYVYFYFVAKYFAQHRDDGDQELQAQLDEIAAKVHVNEYANVIIFLVYLTQDRDLILKMVEHAKAMYADLAPCDLDKDVAFLSGSVSQTLSFPAPNVDYLRNRREDQQELDRTDRPSAGDEEYDSDEDSTAYEASDDLELETDRRRLLGLNPALKALQVLGQILRNFTGSLTGELKKEIAQQCYDLGLRSIQAIFSVIRNRTGDIVTVLAAVLARSGRFSDHSEAEIRIEAERFLFFMCQGFAYGLIQRVSFAVGSAHLKQVYAEILADAPSVVAIELIDASIKLEHLRTIDAQSLVSFFNRVAKNPVASTILRNMVYDHLRLFPVEVSTRQLLLDKLGFRQGNPRFLLRDQ